MLRPRRGGFTLIELLVAIALMILLMTVIIQIFLTSSTVFNRTKAKTEVFQNARYALDRMGAEIQSCVSGSDANQDFRIGSPYDAAPIWYGKVTEFDPDPEGGGEVTEPYLVLTTNTSWIDSKGKRMVGLAKVVYRIKKRYIPDQMARVTCTLQRVLYVTDPTKKGLTVANRMKDGHGVTIPHDDYCQYVYYGRITSSGKASLMPKDVHFAVEHFVHDLSGTALTVKKYYQIAPKDLQSFSSTEAAPYNRLPMSIRVMMDIADEKDREVRTLSRVYAIWAASAN